MKFGIYTQTTLIILILLWSIVTANAQSEMLTNSQIVEMTRAGLGNAVVLKKINNSGGDYDVSVSGLTELKKAGVSDEIISAILEIESAKPKLAANEDKSKTAVKKNDAPKTTAQLLREAKTIAFVKGSAYPSLKEVEGSLMNRERSTRWQKFNLRIVQNREDADLICEVGHDFLTHYNFRVTDIKTGTVITATGVTSLGGALAGNVADKLIKRLNEILLDSNEEKTK